MKKPDTPDDPLITKSTRLPKSIWARLAPLRVTDAGIIPEIEALRTHLDETLPKPARRSTNGGKKRRSATSHD